MSIHLTLPVYTASVQHITTYYRPSVWDYYNSYMYRLQLATGAGAAEELFQQPVSCSSWSDGPLHHPLLHSSQLLHHNRVCLKPEQEWMGTREGWMEGCTIYRVIFVSAILAKVKLSSE